MPTVAFPLSLEDLLGEQREQPKKISHDGQIARIQEAAERFKSNAVPFKVGDLVTPRKDGLIREDFVGDPRLVIDVRPDADYDFSVGEPGGPDFGCRYNVRTLSLQFDHVIAHWCDAAYLEPYQGDGLEVINNEPC